ncbi:MAG: flagellar biosynthesis protein FlhA [Chloroflexi bacterium]|nr:MAG: flagellar biosynthesis protein FlhA [Chloroflexota bacterium]
MTVNTSVATKDGLRRILDNSDVVLAVAVIAIVAMMVIPMPTAMLDLMLAFNIALAVTITLVSLYIQKPLDFSVFPSLLLILTLFRLALNVSSTRLILLTANAGSIINAFGNFVVGGNYVVGVVVFLILMAIQFIVITNGAGRVAEVAARFTLDAMPGKQMSIDADLNAGLITEDQARARRKEIEHEADFYGAMDGASKFVKGDAIAGVVIVLVNIIGGFIIGMFQLNMTLMEALQTYTLLTVGDGLVSQIPALLISTATGIIVTRTAADDTMGGDVVKQITGNHRALMIVAAMLFGFALVPGLPKIPFIVMGIVAGAAGYFVRREKQTSQIIQSQVAEEQQAKQPAADADSVTALLQVDTLELEIGYGLIPLVESGNSASLLDRITMIRRQVAMEMGFILPKIRIRDNLQLPPNVYAIKLRGAEVARGSLMPGQYMAMAAGPVVEQIPGVSTTEPAFGLPAVWIDATHKERAETLGYTVVDPASVVATHLTEVVKMHAPEIVSRQDVRNLLDNLKEIQPALVEDLIPGVMSLSDVHDVLKNLLRERVSIRDLVTIMETISALAPSVKDPDLLAEATRQKLARSISNQNQAADGAIHVVTLSPRVERMLSQAMGDLSNGISLNMEPGIAQQLLEATAQQMEGLAAQGYMPVVLCSATIRLAFKRLTERALPNLSVLSYSEIASGVDVHAEGMVDVPIQSGLAGENAAAQTAGRTANS